MKMTGSQILIECLKKEGVKTLFAYPGGVNLPIFDVLYDEEICRFLTYFMMKMRLMWCSVVMNRAVHTWLKVLRVQREKRVWSW